MKSIATVTVLLMFAIASLPFMAIGFVCGFIRAGFMFGISLSESIGEYIS